MKIRGKILIGYLIVLAIFAVAAGIQVYQLRQVTAGYDRVFQKEVQKASEANRFLILFEKLPIAFRGYLISGNQEEMSRYTSTNAEAVLQLQKLGDLLTSEQEKEIFANLQKKYEEFRKVIGYLTELKGQVLSIEAELASMPVQSYDRIKMEKRYQLEEQRTLLQKEIAAYMTERQKVIDEAVQAGQDFVSLQEINLKEAVRTSQSLVKSIEFLNYLAVGIALLLGLIIAFYMGRLIGKPLQQVEQGVSRIAGGDLTVADIKSNTRDEVGSLARSFNQMKNALREVVQKMTEGAQAVFHAAGQLSENAQQTSQGAMATASAISEVAAAVEDGASNAGKAAEAAEKAAGLASAGNAKLERLVTQMGSIEASARQVARTISELGETSREITKIVEMITNIADQTNLLALNAAIEAARAGEQGRGFAVVAEEVRKLAEQSGKAAGEIYQLIHRIQERASGAIASTEESTRQVEAGNFIVQEVGELFTEIIQTVQELSTQIQEVAATAEQVAGGVQNVAGTAEEQTAAMEEVSASAEGLHRLATGLEEAASRFKL